MSPILPRVVIRKPIRDGLRLITRRLEEVGKTSAAAEQLVLDVLAGRVQILLQRTFGIVDILARVQLRRSDRENVGTTRGVIWIEDGPILAVARQTAILVLGFLRIT